MRAALWLLALFAVAVAAALFVGNNQGTVTVFWPPYRVDLSLNLVVLLTLALYLLVHVALRTLAALLALPQQARLWRQQHRERSLFAHLLDAQLHQYAGRFSRARKAALAALQQEQGWPAQGAVAHDTHRVRALGHLLAAEASHALQDKEARAEHLQAVLDAPLPTRSAAEAAEGVRMRAARWALDDRDVESARQHLDALPQGAARRTIALRMRLKAARLGGQPLQALETARLLAKHRAFSEGAAQSLVRGLAQDLVGAAHDTDQLRQAWSKLESHEQHAAEVAVQAAQRWLTLGGDRAVALQWITPVWESFARQPGEMGDATRLKLVLVLQAALQDGSGPQAAQWLSRVETAQKRHPGDAHLQYLSGRVCMAQQLWGKAQQQLEVAVVRLAEPALVRQAWQSLEALAQRRGDTQAAQRAQAEAASVA